AKLTQTMWNGIVATWGAAYIAALPATPTAMNAASTSRPSRDGSARHEAVTDIAHRLDQSVPQFGADPPYVHVDDVAAFGVVGPAPHDSEELRARTDHARVSHEVFQQGELALRQRHHLAVDHQLVTLQVQTHRPDVQPMFVCPPRLVAQPRLDPGDQLLNGERLGQVVRGAHRQATHPALDVADRREDNDLWTYVAAGQPLQHFEAVHAREHQVEHNEVDRNSIDQLQCFVAVSRGGDCIAVTGQRLAQEPGDPRFVVDDEHLSHGSSHSGHSLRPPPRPPPSRCGVDSTAGSSNLPPLLYPQGKRRARGPGGGSAGFPRKSGPWSHPKSGD